VPVDEAGLCEVSNLWVKPFEELSPFRVKPQPLPNHTHFRQGIISKKETQLGKYQLSRVKKLEVIENIWRSNQAPTFVACKRAMIWVVYKV
jgi:hypothetical protein